MTNLTEIRDQNIDLLSSDIKTDDTDISRFLESVKNYTQDYKTLIFLGHLILKSEESLKYTEAVALDYYQKAISLDDSNYLAYEAIGRYYDLLSDDLDKTILYFSEAIKRDGSIDSFLGCSRALAQNGKEEEALKLITEDECKYFDHSEILELKTEIENGEWSE